MDDPTATELLQRVDPAVMADVARLAREGRESEAVALLRGDGAWITEHRARMFVQSIHAATPRVRSGRRERFYQLAADALKLIHQTHPAATYTERIQVVVDAVLDAQRPLACPRCGPTGDPLTCCTVCGEEWYTREQSLAHTAAVREGRLPRAHLSQAAFVRPGPHACGFYGGAGRYCRLAHHHPGEHQPT